MLFSQYPLHRSGRGFSLVEIMIAVAVGMIGILIIMQVFLVAEGQKRRTTGGANAQENALMAMFTLERELRMAGLGMAGLGLGVIGLGCATIAPSPPNPVGSNIVNSYNGAAYSFSPWPVTIEPDTPAAGSDRITIRYSNSPFGNIPASLSSAAATSNDPFVVADSKGAGFAVGDLVIVSDPATPAKACTVAQISATAGGPPWTLTHAAGFTFAGGPTYNPVANNFPAGGYPINARLTNMGSMVNHEYYVDTNPASPTRNNLMMRDVNRPNSATNPVALVSGVVSIRAQYGKDSDADRWVDAWNNTALNPALELVAAVRLAVVALSGQYETAAVSPATLVLWNGGTTANGGALNLLPGGPLGPLLNPVPPQQYRYKTYQTTIPLRNVLWNNI